MKIQKYKFNTFQSKWLKALESGKYKQGMGQLCEVTTKNQEKLCCLGVACEVYNNEVAPKQHRKKLKKVLVDVDEVEYNGNSSLLPSLITEKLKLKSDSGSIDYVKVENTSDINDGVDDDLASMNDGGDSHKKIAKFIRNNPLAVFN